MPAAGGARVRMRSLAQEAPMPVAGGATPTTVGAAPSGGATPTTVGPRSGGIGSMMVSPTTVGVAGSGGGDWNEECNSPSGEEMGNSHDPTPAASATDNGGARLATKSESPASELQCDSRSRSGSNDDRLWRRDRARRRSPSPPRPPIAAHESEHKLGRILRDDSQFKLRPAKRRARNHARPQLEPPPPPPPEQNWRPRGPAWD